MSRIPRIPEPPSPAEAERYISYVGRDAVETQSESETRTVRVERYTLDKVAWCFNGVVAGQPLTLQQRAWLDQLLYEAYRA